MLLQAVAAQSTSAWTPPAWVTIVAIGLTWVVGIIAVARFRMDLRSHTEAMERAKKERDRELEETAMRACRDFINSKEYREMKDQRIKEIAETVIDDAFTRRSSSFVSAERFDERMRAFEGRMTNVEGAIKENTEKIGEMGGKIAQAVTTQLTAYLASRVFGPRE